MIAGGLLEKTESEEAKDFAPVLVKVEKVEISFDCLQCAKPFKSGIARDQHSRMAHPVLKCNFCSEIFDTEKARDAH